MTDTYNRAVAAHYAAYRPPLHAVILERVFAGGASFDGGLDVGCGTGRSAVALAAYGTPVYAVDPSPAMLREATRHANVTYLHGAAEDLPLPDQSVEVVTFAGSLFYADVRAAAAEVRRVARREALIVAYDFEVLLEDIVRLFGIEPPVSESDYDHRVNFSEVDGFVEQMNESEQVALALTPAECAHLVLADRHRYDALAARFEGAAPFSRLVDALWAGAPASIPARIYYATYRLTDAERSPLRGHQPFAEDR